MNPPTTVSVVIPTRARADTLDACLRTVVTQDWPELEIIVSNNGCDLATRDVVARIADPRIRCVEPDSLLSMAHNYEFGLSHATGQWLVVIGDDDGILPGGLRRGLDILTRSGASALASPTCLFQWPIAGQRRDGPFLTVPMGRGWEWRSSEAAIRRMLNRDMGFNDAPVTYTGGIVSADLFNEIKQVRGTFFQSQIPDCYSAFALCSVTDRYVLAREPLMVAGVSRHSHGRVSLAAQPNAFDRYDNIPFHPDIVLPDGGSFTSSFQAMLYESYLQSAYLRTAPAITDRRAQVVAILAYARWFRSQEPGADRAADVAEGWARKAAATYGFDFAAIDRAAARLPLRARLAQHRQALRRFLGHFVLDGRHTTPPENVYDASLVAAGIRDRRPNRMRSFGNTALRKLATH